MTITTIQRWGHRWPIITAEGALSYAEDDPGYRLRVVTVDDLAGRARGGQAAPHLFGGAEVVARAERSITVRLPPGGGLVDWTERMVVYHLPDRRLVWTGPMRDVGQVPGLPRLLGDREDGLLEARLREAEVFYREVLAGREMLFAEVAEAARGTDGKGVAIGAAGLVLPLRAVDELAQAEGWNARAHGRGRMDLDLVDAWQVEEPAERPGYTALVPLLCGLAAPLSAEALRAGAIVLHALRRSPWSLLPAALAALGVDLETIRGSLRVELHLVTTCEPAVEDVEPHGWGVGLGGFGGE